MKDQPATPTGSSDFLTGITKRRWTGLVLVWLAISLPFLLAYVTSHRVVLNGIRNQVMGVAITVASMFDAELLKAIQGPDDEGSDAFVKAQMLLSKVRDANPDVHFIYTMRRARSQFSPVSDYEYIVDSIPRDFNGNGAIDADEESESPGATYDAAELPALINAWNEPDADYDITKDPPYPDLISGYAPIRDADNRTMAIVGVDVLASTISEKMLAIRVVMFLVWFVISILVTLVIHLYYQQRDAFERIKHLNEELESRNELLREANETMARNADQFERELKLAQAVQIGFLPTTFPRQDRIIFDKYYLTCAILGGDLFDVFDVDEDHVGLFMADVAGHGVSAALISGLLKMAISSVRDRGTDSASTLYADLTRPDAVVKKLNALLVKEMPENEFITLIYAVINMSENKLLFANAGHPWPIRYVAKGRTHVVCQGRSGMALGLEENQEYPLITVDVSEGDKILFYTDGLTEAMNARGEEFGDERFHAVVDTYGHSAPNEIIAATREAVEAHRGKHEVSDDFSMLVAEIR